MYGAAFGASFIFIFFKAFQQRNVAYEHYRWILPTSMLMAFTEFYVVAQVAIHGYDLALLLCVGLGGGLGCLLSVFLHRRFL